MNKAYYPRPPLSQIEQDLPGRGVTLYIGDSQAASSPELLLEHGITTIVNCAVNLDINLVDSNLAPTLGGLIHGPGMFRYYKIGMIDGPGNPYEQMLAAYFILRAALDQVMPDKPSYPHQARGNVLVHCRGGRSRSVTLVSLFLHLELPNRYPTIESALAHVRKERQLHPDEWHETPKPELFDAARVAARQVKLLLGEPDEQLTQVC
ncbi:MAG: dual specificity protein phosphatase family protein [Halomonas sp.]|nr:dual specificity protein phosphatase [Halomonas sp.]MCC5903800.1 dual specificity protein phosphatase family protein [Halomonas sp.]